MNAPERQPTASELSQAPQLAGLVFAMLAGADDDGSQEARWLTEWRDRIGGDLADPASVLREWLIAPPESDRRIRDVATQLGLVTVEIVAAAVSVIV